MDPCKSYEAEERTVGEDADKKDPLIDNFMGDFTKDSSAENHNDNIFLYSAIGIFTLILVIFVLLTCLIYACLRCKRRCNPYKWHGERKCQKCCRWIFGILLLLLLPLILYLLANAIDWTCKDRDFEKEHESSYESSKPENSTKLRSIEKALVIDYQNFHDSAFRSVDEIILSSSENAKKDLDPDLDSACGTPAARQQLNETVSNMQKDIDELCVEIIMWNDFTRAIMRNMTTFLVQTKEGRAFHSKSNFVKSDNLWMQMSTLFKMSELLRLIGSIVNGIDSLYNQSNMLTKNLDTVVKQVLTPYLDEVNNDLKGRGNALRALSQNLTDDIAASDASLRSSDSFDDERKYKAVPTWVLIFEWICFVWIILIVIILLLALILRCCGQRWRGESEYGRKRKCCSQECGSCLFQLTVYMMSLLFLLALLPIWWNYEQGVGTYNDQCKKQRPDTPPENRYRRSISNGNAEATPKPFTLKARDEVFQWNAKPKDEMSEPSTAAPKIFTIKTKDEIPEPLTASDTKSTPKTFTINAKDEMSEPASASLKMFTLNAPNEMSERLMDSNSVASPKTFSFEAKDEMSEPLNYSEAKTTPNTFTVKAKDEMLTPLTNSNAKTTVKPLTQKSKDEMSESLTNSNAKATPKPINQKSKDKMLESFTDSDAHATLGTFPLQGRNERLESLTEAADALTSPNQSRSTDERAYADDEAGDAAEEPLNICRNREVDAFLASNAIKVRNRVAPTPNISEATKELEDRFIKIEPLKKKLKLKAKYADKSSLQQVCSDFKTQFDIKEFIRYYNEMNSFVSMEMKNPRQDLQLSHCNLNTLKTYLIDPFDNHEIPKLMTHIGEQCKNIEKHFDGSFHQSIESCLQEVEKIEEFSKNKIAGVLNDTTEDLEEMFANGLKNYRSSAGEELGRAGNNTNNATDRYSECVQYAHGKNGIWIPLFLILLLFLPLIPIAIYLSRLYSCDQIRTECNCYEERLYNAIRERLYKRKCEFESQARTYVRPCQDSQVSSQIQPKIQSHTSRRQCVAKVSLDTDLDEVNRSKVSETPRVSQQHRDSTQQQNCKVKYKIKIGIFSKPNPAQLS